MATKFNMFTIRPFTEDFVNSWSRERVIKDCIKDMPRGVERRETNQ